MNPQNPVEGSLLLCLDLQPAFLGAIARGPEILRRCQFAVAAARLVGMPVALTEQVPGKLGRTDPGLLALCPDAPVHAKDSFSALAGGTAVRSKLTDSRAVEHLLLCGIETPICVFQTCADALKAQIAVTVLSDCVGARREADAAVCLEALARAGAHILPAETVFYSVLGGAGHPRFRDYTALVKTYA